MTVHRKRLNSAAVINPGVKSLVYGYGANPRGAVRVQRAHWPKSALGQELGWLMPPASDAANAE
jgi:hypothetical protein